MLRKVIAVAMSTALLANASMISSANDSYAENSATTETEVALMSAAAETEGNSTSVETTVTTTDSSVEVTTTTAETMSPEEVGAAIRERLGIKVLDIVDFAGGVEVYDVKGNPHYSDAGGYLWITDIDDAKQRFRVFVPNIEDANVNTLFLNYENASNAKIVSHKGMVIGDVDFNGTINAKDMTWMKRGLIYGWENNKKACYMSDMNADGEVTIKDLELMRNWLICKR